MTNWTIGQAQEDDRQQLIDLFAEYLWKDDPQDVFEWKHERNPSGKTLHWVAKEKGTGRIAGTYLMMPWRLKAKGEEVLITQCVDAVTHVDFRRKGIYLELGKDCVGKLGELGYPYSIAFPNPAALGGHMKLGGWHILGNMIRYVKPLHIDRYVTRKIGAGALAKMVAHAGDKAFSLFDKIRDYKIPKSISFHQTDELGIDFDEFWRRVRPAVPNLFVRDAKYLNWKYLNTPHAKRMVYLMEDHAQINGYVVLEMGKSYGHIVDMLCIMEEKYISSLIAFAVAFFRKQNLPAVSYSALEGNVYFKSLRKMGFSERQDQWAIVFRSNTGSEPSQNMLNSGQWLLTMGDCDIESMG